jgi:methylenetetrahydrofolate reductase (NADPH)
MRSDRDFLAEKLRLAEFGVTQFFFRLEEYLGLVDDLSTRNISTPVVPGIMPVTSLSSIARMAEMGAAVPSDMAASLEAAGDAESVRKAGTELACRLCQQLLDAGAPGLHFYTLNRSLVTREIYTSLNLAAPAR